MIITPLFALAVASPHGQCREIHYAADGSVTERMVADDGDNSVSASSHSTGSNHASSSVSLSSHSGGQSNADAAAAGDDAQRSVSVSRGPDGCTIVIDERDPSDRSSR